LKRRGSRNINSLKNKNDGTKERAPKLYRSGAGKQTRKTK